MNNNLINNPTLVIPNDQFDKFVSEEIVKWKNDTNVIAVIIDDGGQPTDDIKKVKGAFPIFKNDTLEDALKKYVKVFSHEWQAFEKEQKARIAVLRNDKGLSKGKTMKYFGSLPPHLYEMINWIFPQYTEDKKGWTKLSKILSSFFVGKI